MATHIPAKLKAADLTRFIVRAAQLEKAKPVISYWCEYWIVEQILAKGLHNGDSETLQYTTQLMDKLEQVKSENATNDAIMDDIAGQAYVEDFGLETFQRADRAVQANKVTKQTADTFQAASTFLELVNIWGPPDEDTAAKTKYAKWNAVRIVRALKEGKDPNDSNPKTNVSEQDALPPLDPQDPEVQSLENTKSLHAAVEDVTDEQDRLDRGMVRQSSIDASLHPSAHVSAQISAQVSPAGFQPYSSNGTRYSTAQDDNVSPLESSPQERKSSAGGGYFPEVPSFAATSHESTYPSGGEDSSLGLPQQPNFVPGSRTTGKFEPSPPPVPDDAPSAPPQDYYRQAPPPPTFQSSIPSSINTSLAPQPPSPAGLVLVPVSPPVQPPPNKTPLNVDDVAIARAQKHAKWAISALNFEDTETAVRELRAALQTLGAS